VTNSVLAAKVNPAFPLQIPWCREPLLSTPSLKWWSSTSNETASYRTPALPLHVGEKFQ
jgi:hypothetical protein